jgi:hypothetical protein
MYVYKGAAATGVRASREDVSENTFPAIMRNLKHNKNKAHRRFALPTSSGCTLLERIALPSGDVTPPRTPTKLAVMQRAFLLMQLINPNQMTLPAYMTQDSVASATTMRLRAFMKHAKTATGASSYFKTLLNK